MEGHIADAQRPIDYFLELLPSKSGLGTDAIVFVLDAVRPAVGRDATAR